MTDFAGLLDRHIPDPVRDRRGASRGAGRVSRRTVVARRDDDLSGVAEFGAFLAALRRVTSPAAGSTAGTPSARTALRPPRRITSRPVVGTGCSTP